MREWHPSSSFQVHVGDTVGFEGCIVCDLLSMVISRSQKGQIWVTHHKHPNVIAVASLKELAAVIIVEGARPDQETLSRAAEHNITLITTELAAYDVVVLLASHAQGRNNNG